MNDTDLSGGLPAIVLRRVYRAPRASVYDAWTNPTVAAKFLGPNDADGVSDVRMDVRTGGSYSIVMHMANGEHWTVGGIYREIVPPAKLVMTWRWQEDDPKDEVETLLTLEFNEHDDGTELILRHEQFTSGKSRDSHEEGWSDILTTLGSIVERPAGVSS